MQDGRHALQLDYISQHIISEQHIDNNSQLHAIMSKHTLVKVVS